MAREKRDTKRSRSKPAQSGGTSAKESAANEGQGRRADRDRSLEGNQGEGNREADRRYREEATSFERSGRVPKAAEDARRAIEDEDRKLGGGRDGDDIDVDDYDEERVEDEEEARREARDRSRLS